MPCALPTTTIRIERPPDSTDDPGVGQTATYQDPWGDVAALDPQTVVECLPAHIGNEKGKPRRDGANVPDVYYELSVDLCDLRKDDFVVDEQTLVRYRVNWVFDRRSSASPSLNRTRASLMRVDGATDDPVR